MSTIAEQLRTAENPVSLAARQIQLLVGTFIKEDLNGTLPKQSNYGHSSYDVLFTPTRKLDSRTSNLIILSSNCQFLHGPVVFREGSDNGKWDIEEASKTNKLVLAPPLEIVRHAPALISFAINLVHTQLSGEQDLERIKKGLQVLEKGPQLVGELVDLSRAALIEMGEDNPQLAAELIQIDLTKLKSAYELAAKKDSLVAEVEELARGGRARLVEDWFRTQASWIAQEGLFSGRLLDGKPWAGSPNWRSNHSKGAEPWYWAISKEGEVREHPVGFNPEMRRCPEHLLEQAGTIFNWLATEAVQVVYKKLE